MFQVSIPDEMIFFHFLPELIVLLSELLTESLNIIKGKALWVIKHAPILYKDCDKYLTAHITEEEFPFHIITIAPTTPHNHC